MINDKKNKILFFLFGNPSNKPGEIDFITFSISKTVWALSIGCNACVGSKISIDY